MNQGSADFVSITGKMSCEARRMALFFLHFLAVFSGFLSILIPNIL